MAHHQYVNQCQCQCHPHPSTDFSFVSRNTDHGASRLDKWLVAEALLQHQPHSTIIDDFDSDHRGVTFDFTLPGSVLRARPPWRFPLPLLADADFVTELKGALDRLKADRLHQQDSTRRATDFLRRLSAARRSASPSPDADDAPQDPLDADPQGLLEDMLACIRLLSQQRTGADCRRKRLELRRLQQAVTFAASLLPTAVTDDARAAAHTAFHAAADALQAHHDRRAQQALDRARALELMFFEKPTHYFHARCDPRHFSDTTFTYAFLHYAVGCFMSLFWFLICLCMSLPLEPLHGP